jgi:hypothetical protein
VFPIEKSDNNACVQWIHRISIKNIQSLLYMDARDVSMTTNIFNFLFGGSGWSG